MNQASSSSASSYLACFKKAEQLVSYGEEIGFHMVMVDIGGGFAGHTHLQCNVKELSVSVNEAVDDITRKHPNLKVFAEPGNSYTVFIR